MTNPAIEERVQSVLDSWNGTPYLLCSRIKAMGVDCYQIVAAFLDEMFGRPLGYTELPRLSPQLARNRPDMAKEAIRRLRKAHYGSDSVPPGQPVEPGDILVMRSIIRTDGPAFEGHTMIAGVRPFTVLHAINPRVAWASSEGRQIMKVYRPREKQLWA